MFCGINSLNLDAKGRMAMPTCYRQRLSDICGGQIMITVDRSERCLLVYPKQEWEIIERKLQKLPSFNKQARRLQRLLIGHAAEVEMDGSGRLLVPPPLREFAGMEKRVVLVGQSNKFELWDEALWDERRAAWLAEEDDLGEQPEEMKTFSL